MENSTNSSVTAGEDAQTPMEMPSDAWWQILRRVWKDIGNDHVSVVAAGIAFYGLIALFPAVAAFVSLSGLLLDPADVSDQLQKISAILPESAATIVRDQIVKVTGGGTTPAGIVALTGLIVALYGATKGMLTLIEGLNIAYDEDEKRNILWLYATAAALTVFGILVLVLSIGLVILLPVIAEQIEMSKNLERLVTASGWLTLAMTMIMTLAVVYRFAPSRADPKWRWVSVGAVLATVVWIIATLLFSAYVRQFGSYTETYGALGGVVILLTWLWLSAFVILAGAELNAEIEQQTAIDTTTGAARPMGLREAVKADTPPPGTRANVGPAMRMHDGGRLLAESPATELLMAGALAGRALWRITNRKKTDR